MSKPIPAAGFPRWMFNQNPPDQSTDLYGYAPEPRRPHRISKIRLQAMGRGHRYQMDNNSNWWCRNCGRHIGARPGNYCTATVIKHWRNASDPQEETTND